MKMAMIITMVRDIDEQMYRNEQHSCIQYDAVITRTKRNGNVFTLVTKHSLFNIIQ